MNALFEKEREVKTAKFHFEKGLREKARSCAESPVSVSWSESGSSAGWWWRRSNRQGRRCAPCPFLTSPCRGLLFHLGLLLRHLSGRGGCRRPPFQVCLRIPERGADPCRERPPGPFFAASVLVQIPLAPLK